MPDLTSLLRTEVFVAGADTKVAYLFAGYKGKITGYRQAIKTLNRHGYTVIAYEHDPDVLRKGNPQDLLDVLDEIHQNVLSSIGRYEEAICAGVSLGVGLGFSLQRVMSQKIRFGIYAGAGVSPSASIFKSPLFCMTQKAFRKNGHSQDSLYKSWDEHEIIASMPLPKNTSFVIALGKRDRIVRYEEATAVYKAWSEADVRIKVITKKSLGHLGIIRWYKQNLETLLDEAEKLTS